MRLTVVASEVPYPPVSGGRSDVWGRLEAFRNRGIAVHLVTWFVERRGRPSKEALAALRRTVDELSLLPLSAAPIALFRRVWWLSEYPPHVSSRLPTRDLRREVRERDGRFRADAVWLDGLYGGLIAEELALASRIPLYYRSHNIEHAYMRGQARVAAPAHRPALLLACVGLRRYEERMLARCARFFDISADDLDYWRGRGMSHGDWLPPTVIAPPARAAARVADYDVAYVASLDGPGNVEAARWLVNRVVPELRGLRRRVSLIIGGARPTRAVRDLCDVDGVRLVADPRSAWDVYFRARVLVNPAQRGSGVQMKTVEMLHTRVPIVCTPVGAMGLPAEVKSLLRIAESPAGFAEAIHASLSAPVVDLVERSDIRRVFGEGAIDEVLRVLAEAQERMVSDGSAGCDAQQSAASRDAKSRPSEWERLV